MKINFLNYLDKKGILFLSETTKEDVLNAMVVRAAELCRIPVDILKEAVWERERKVSTGLGNGLALPHVRLTRFGEPLVVLGISKEGIADYQTTDDTTIDMIVLLIADGRDTDLYLELMKSAILKLKARKNIEAVKQCGDDPVAVINLLRHL
ncbi:MAG: PTS sugar transporter subunit IIA [Victivallales bacterium]|nr:PTS sugar transporter subunit IIA [Victivallales bacterium]